MNPNEIENNIENNLNEQKQITKKIKKTEKAKDGKKCAMGKPKGLACIQLENPQIWANCQQSLNLINYLLKFGRHIFVNLQTEKKNEVHQQKEQLKQIYQHLEYIAKHIFEYPCSKLNVVYFFRNDYSPNVQKVKPQLQNEKWRIIIQKIYFLLNHQFLNEFINILDLFEKNLSDEKIAEILIMNAKLRDPNQQDQIIQSLYLNQQKTQENINLFTQLTLSNLEYQKQNFYDVIQNSQEQLQQFIQKIREIMIDKRDQVYSNGYRQNDEYVYLEI